MSAASGDVLELIKETLLGDADFNGELENWCVQRCGAFSNSLEGGEHKLEWTTLHEEFCRLFEAIALHHTIQPYHGRAKLYLSHWWGY